MIWDQENRLFYPIKKAKEVTMSNTINVNYMTRAYNQYQQKNAAKDQEKDGGIQAVHLQ